MRPLKESLFYTKDGDLDFGWAILLLACAIGLTVFVAESIGLIRGPSIAGWSWFGAFTSMAFIAGAAISRARLIAKTTDTPYSNPPKPSAEPNLWTDNEQGDMT